MTKGMPSTSYPKIGYKLNNGHSIKQLQPQQQAQQPVSKFQSDMMKIDKRIVKLASNKIKMLKTFLAMLNQIKQEKEQEKKKMYFKLYYTIKTKPCNKYYIKKSQQNQMNQMKEDYHYQNINQQRNQQKMISSSFESYDDSPQTTYLNKQRQQDEIMRILQTSPPPSQNKSFDERPNNFRRKIVQPAQKVPIENVTINKSFKSGPSRKYTFLKYDSNLLPKPSMRTAEQREDNDVQGFTEKKQLDNIPNNINNQTKFDEKNNFNRSDIVCSKEIINNQVNNKEVNNNQVNTKEIKNNLINNYPSSFKAQIENNKNNKTLTNDKILLQDDVEFESKAQQSDDFEVRDDIDDFDFEEKDTSIEFEEYTNQKNDIFQTPNFKNDKSNQKAIQNTIELQTNTEILSELKKSESQPSKKQEEKKIIIQNFKVVKQQSISNDKQNKTMQKDLIKEPSINDVSNQYKSTSTNTNNNNNNLTNYQVTSLNESAMDHESTQPSQNDQSHNAQIFSQNDQTQIISNSYSSKIEQLEEQLIDFISQEHRDLDSVLGRAFQLRDEIGLTKQELTISKKWYDSFLEKYGIIFEE